MRYENEDEKADSDNTDDVFLPKPSSSNSLSRSPPEIPIEPEDPLYATAEEYNEKKPENPKIVVSNNEYAYISNNRPTSTSNVANGQDPDNAYSEVQVTTNDRPKVEMRKSTLKRLAGNSTVESTASFEPGYDRIANVQRTPSDYKPEVVQLSPLPSDTDTSGSSEGTDRNSNTTLIASQVDDLDVLPSDLHFEPIPRLKHPRVELTFGGAFDEIRRFIANNRGPSEMYAMPNKHNSNGEAIKKLKTFLSSIESQSAV